MSWAITTMVLTFAASLVLTAAIRAAAGKFGVVDRPDGKRKLHDQPVPLWGGVAVYAATAIGLALALLGAGDTPLLRLSGLWMVAAGIVCLVGGIDDCFELSPRVKLALQVVSVLPIVCCGYYVDRIVVFGWAIELGWVGVPLTVLWLLGCINALNLLDGMDGLASIVGLSTAGMMGMIAANLGHTDVAAMAMILAAALAGFLVYNLPPASVFLGDSGSMVIGLSVGMLGMQGTLKTSATLAITAPAVVMTLPLFDVVAAIVRRQTFRPPHRPARSASHPPSPLAARLDPLASPLPAGRALPFDRRRRRRRHDLPARRPGLDRRDDADRADDPPAALRAPRVCLGQARRDPGVVWDSLMRRFRTLNRGKGDRHHCAKTRWTVPANGPGPCSPSLPTPDLWDRFVRDLLTWDVREAEFRASRGDRLRYLRWIDPRARLDQPCRWSLSVSIPGRDGELCQLQTAGPRPLSGSDRLAALTLLLKDYGSQFAAHAEMLFGPPVASEHPSHQRKAA